MPAILVIVPLIAAAILSLLVRRPAVKYIALLASILSLLIAVQLFLSPPVTESLQWFNAFGLDFNITTSTFALNTFMLMLVSVITPLVFLYSIGFMDIPSEQPRFYFEMCIFAASMMLFAISGSFITLFIAWEMLGITSYMLIGFWYNKEKAPTAARKAITTILIGDIAMLIGILVIGVYYGSFDISTVLLAQPSQFLEVALALMLIGAFTKSAQFPFHEWLADAMEGPTPVSAFLHSSTMVKAGVFLIIILFPLYQAAHLQIPLLIIGILSALVGVTNALTERHIKKILAYSTIEDLGLMFIALGLNSVVAAISLFFVQTFYKALLFMGAGSVMRANEERDDIFSIYGASQNKLLFLSILIGALSIAGIFPLSGFIGKNFVENAAQNVLVYAVLLAINLGTSLYIFRWFFVVSRKSYGEEGLLRVNFKTLPKTMMLPILVLAILVFGAWFFYSYLPIPTGAGFTPEGAAVGNIVAIIGIVVAYRIYRQGHRLHLKSTNKALYSLLYNSAIANWSYLMITRIFARIARASGYNDFALDKSTYALAQGTISAGGIGRKIVNGQTNLYVLGFVLGLVLLIAAFVL